MSSTPDREPSTDPWSRPLVNEDESNAARRPVAATRAAKHVPDAWDDDDEAEEEEQVEVDNAKLWHDANTKTPMPEVMIINSGPPPSAFQQPMRILKRPSGSASSSPSGNSAGAGAGTLKDREAAYQAARARIFGSTGEAEEGNGASNSDLQATQTRLKEPSTTATTANSKPRSQDPAQGTLPSVSVLRNPRGPSESPSSSPGPPGTNASPSPKGFARRRGGKASRGSSGGNGSGSGSGSTT